MITKGRARPTSSFRSSGASSSATASLSARLSASPSSVLFAAHARAQGLEDRRARRHAAVGLQQRGLELLEQRLVDLAACEKLGDRRIEDVARAREARLEARGPGRRCYHGSVDSNKGQVRIIAGLWRGRRIAVPSRPGLRPTPDRVRETLFNWLGQWLDGLACLDLFAGSGALGFEAASRRAARVVMVENDRAAFAVLEKTESGHRRRPGRVDLRRRRSAAEADSAAFRCGFPRSAVRAECAAGRAAGAAGAPGARRAGVRRGRGGGASARAVGRDQGRTGRPGELPAAGMEKR